MMKIRLLFILLYLTSFSVFSGTVTALKDDPNSAEPNQNLAVFADFLYWHASEQTASSWAYIPELPNITSPNIYLNHFATRTKEEAVALPNQTLVPEFFNGFTTLTPFNSAHLNWQLMMN